MATTQNTFNGNGSNLGPFSFTFKWLESTDIKVSVGGVLKTAGTHYNLQGLNYTTKTGGQVLFTAGNAPANGTSIRIYRDTDDETLSAIFSSGSAIRAKDLNDNFSQNLYITQEVRERYLDRQSGEMDPAYIPTTSSGLITKGYMETNYGVIDEVGFTRWGQIAIAAQTTFTGSGSYGGVLSYVPTKEQVYLNGALQQRDADYSANDGTSITFNVALTAGDVVDVVCVNNLTASTVSNAANISYDGQFTGQSTRTVAAKLADVVSVKDFGAVGDGVADDTAAIQAAINTAKRAIVPPGLYKVTTTLSISSGRHLHLETGATIEKPAGTISPVVRLIGNYSQLTGEGYASVIRTPEVTGNPSNPTTEGIVNIGPSSLTSSANINWARVSGLRLANTGSRRDAYISSGGVNTAVDLDIGLKMVNGDNFSAGSSSLYNTTVENLCISGVGVGIDAEPVVQGNHFRMIYFAYCTLYGFRFKGCNENAISHTFFHQSGGITFVRLERALSAAAAAAAGFTYYAYPDRDCSENQFVNLMGEPGATGPGGRNARVYNFGVGVSKTYIQGHNNTGSGNLDASGTTNNIVILEGAINGGTLSNATSISSNAFSGASATFNSTDTTNKTQAHGYEWRRLGHWGFLANDKRNIGTLQLTLASTDYLVELTAVHGWTSSSTSSWGTSRMLINVNRGNTTNISTQLFSIDKTTTSGFTVPDVTGDTVTFGYFSQHDSTVQVYYRIVGARLSSANLQYSGFVFTALDGTAVSTAATIPGGRYHGYVSFLPLADNAHSLGSASNRWSQVFAAIGTISTSDANLKDDIRSLSDKESAVATAIKQLVRAYRFKNAIAKKGDDARIHVGVIAQDVEQAFITEGLDPASYGLFCRDTWYELNGSRVDVEDGDKPPAEAVLVERLGIRYDELLAFIISSL